MSYILDALKKAEAERHIGQVPGLHAQPAAALPLGPTPMRSNKLLLTVAALLLAGGGLAWLQPWKSSAMQSGQPAGAQTLPATPVTPPSSAAVAASTPGPQVVAVSPPPEPIKPVVRETAKPRTAVPPQPPAAKKSMAAADTSRRAAVQAASVPESPAAANANSDLKLSTALTPEAGAASPRELPEQIQRELPSLSIGGYIYSDNPRERQLLVNKRLLHEGAEAAPGVRLEKMLPNAAVFIYKGYRYRLPY